MPFKTIDLWPLPLNVISSSTPSCSFSNLCNDHLLAGKSFLIPFFKALIRDVHFSFINEIFAGYRKLVEKKSFFFPLAFTTESKFYFLSILMDVTEEL
jgi:hypothetical protein